jgi:hypothetical protein
VSEDHADCPLCEAELMQPECRSCERYAELLASARDRGSKVEEDHVLALWREHDLRVGHVTP